MDHYAKLFDLSWIEPWLAEALIIMGSALLLGLILCKVVDCMNGENQ
jgi:hypothetical protein